MAAIKLAMVIDGSNPIVGDLYIDPTTGTTRLCATLGEEVQQLLWTRLRFFAGEWFLDPAAGVPYYQKILGIKNSQANVAAIFRQVITSTPGVASLDTFALNPVGRALSPKFSCTLSDGTVLQSTDFAPLYVTAG